MTMLHWTLKRAGVIAPDERLPWGSMLALGCQHVLAMFGSTVVAPLIMGFDPNLAILFSGIGTLAFFLIVGGRIPSYLGSSFAFIGPVAGVMGSAAGGTLHEADLPKALGGIIAAGVVYAVVGLWVNASGSPQIDALMPPVVTGAVVMMIGLNLASAARGLAANDPLIAILTILAIMLIATFTRGLLARLPILLGTATGYLLALLLGGPSAEGRSFGIAHIQGVDLSRVMSAPWFAIPHFVGPEFDARAISLVAPVAIVLIAENTGHIKAVATMTNRELMPLLGRGFLGDGVATMLAGLGGGTGVTTYAENIGVMSITRVYSSLLFVIAACVAILLGLSPKFGALIGSIPPGVLGGVSTVLFGLIAITGGRIWVESRVDFTNSANLLVAAAAVIAGTADYTLRIGSFEMAGIGVGTFGAIVLYQILRHAPPGAEVEPPREATPAEEHRATPLTPAG